MPLMLGPLPIDAGIDPAQVLVIRRAYARKPEENRLFRLRADSTHAEILGVHAKSVVGQPSVSGDTDTG